MNNKFPIYVILDNIRSLYNIGAFFRTCDATGVQKIFISGFAPVPPRKEITKTALGAEHSVPFEYVQDAAQAVRKLKKQKVQVVAVETGQQSQDYDSFKPKFPICLIFGNEVTGISPELLDLADARIKIPMFGMKESLNVVVCGGIILYDMVRKFNSSPKSNWS